jgi:hypothetical protein
LFDLNDRHARSDTIFVLDVSGKGGQAPKKGQCINARRCGLGTRRAKVELCQSPKSTWLTSLIFPALG